MNSIEEKLKEMGYELPDYQAPTVPILSTTLLGNTLYISGHTPTQKGKMIHQGIVGKEVTIEQAQKCAEVCVVNCLCSAKHILCDLSRIKRIIKLNGYVACENGFTQQALVINNASQMLISIYGENGKHARTACGVSGLPAGAPVEIEIIAEIA